MSTYQKIGTVEAIALIQQLVLPHGLMLFILAL